MGFDQDVEGRLGKLLRHCGGSLDELLANLAALYPENRAQRAANGPLRPGDGRGEGNRSLDFSMLSAFYLLPDFEVSSDLPDFSGLDLQCAETFTPSFRL